MKKVILLLTVLLSMIFVSCQKETITLTSHGLEKSTTVPVTIVSNQHYSSVVVFRNDVVIDTIFVSSNCTATEVLTLHKDSLYKFCILQDTMILQNAIKFQLKDIINVFTEETILGCKQYGGGQNVYWSTINTCPDSEMTIYFDYH